MKRSARSYSPCRSAASTTSSFGSRLGCELPLPQHHHLSERLFLVVGEEGRSEIGRLLLEEGGALVWKVLGEVCHRPRPERGVREHVHAGDRGRLLATAGDQEALRIRIKINFIKCTTQMRNTVGRNENKNKLWRRQFSIGAATSDTAHGVASGHVVVRNAGRNLASRVRTAST